MKARHRGEEGGFTLLEILVALVVLGLLMVGLTQGVRAGLALRHAQTNRLAETAELDATMRTLRGLLTRLPVVPNANRAVASTAGGAITGTTDRLSFVGDLPTGLAGTHRANLALYLRDRRLVLSWTPHYHERALGPPQPPTETVLISGVARLELAYWGAPAPGLPSAWQEQWQGAEVPELIRLRLVFAKGDLRRWPDLIAAPRL